MRNVFIGIFLLTTGVWMGYTCKKPEIEFVYDVRRVPSGGFISADGKFEEQCQEEIDTPDGKFIRLIHCKNKKEKDK